MSVLIKIKWLSKHYDKTWDKVSNFILKRFDRKQVRNQNCLKNKVKSYEGKIITNFYDNGIKTDVSHCICLLIVLIGSVFKIGKNNYLQLVLEEFKYTFKEKNIDNYTDDEFEISSDDSEVEVSYEETVDV